ncbi:hypothetical protein [Candidatus Paracaedibacter symbiosus]|uniref:hypothetical protein n=1 Tax=Candidatus Paracaedibacter symbiosus TaxID=244582 RepID=UPI00068BF455|nr:hypothetical protein [Candidatus Paracaedibacter symbiosus]
MKIDRHSPKKSRIPVQLTQKEFDEFICEAIPKLKRGPEGKVPRSKIFNYILKLVYTGGQWKELPIDKDETGKPNIKENTRNQKKTKRGRKRLYSEEIFEKRSENVERVFAWEDKFKRLLIGFLQKRRNGSK